MPTPRGEADARAARQAVLDMLAQGNGTPIPARIPCLCEPQFVSVITDERVTVTLAMRDRANGITHEVTADLADAPGAWRMVQGLVMCASAVFN